MAKKVTKKEAVKPAAKKSAAKKAVERAVKKVPVKKVVKKDPARKAAQKVVKKAARGVARKPPVKKVSVKQAVPKTVEDASFKVVAKKATKRAAKKAVKVEDLEPVVVKRPYVKPEKVAKLTTFEKRQWKRLLDLRDQITDSMYGIQNDTIKNGSEGADSSGSGMHQGDAGSDAYDRDFALTMLSKEANALGEIEQALQRLELGVYGICEESREKIPQPRLEAMPFARLTVACQAAKEKNESLRDRSGRNSGYN